MRDVSCGYVCGLDVPQISQMTGIRTTTVRQLADNPPMEGEFRTASRLCEILFYVLFLFPMILMCLCGY